MGREVRQFLWLLKASCRTNLQGGRILLLPVWIHWNCGKKVFKFTFSNACSVFGKTASAPF